MLHNTLIFSMNTYTYIYIYNFRCIHTHMYIYRTRETDRSSMCHYEFPLVFCLDWWWSAFSTATRVWAELDHLACFWISLTHVWGQDDMSYHKSLTSSFARKPFKEQWTSWRYSNLHIRHTKLCTSDILKAAHSTYQNLHRSQTQTCKQDIPKSIHKTYSNLQTRHTKVCT